MRFSGPAGESAEPANVPSLGEAFARWLGRSPLREAITPQMAYAHWASTVGPQIAAVTEVASVRDGKLTVRASNSVWAAELRMLSDDILARLNHSLGSPVLKSIRFTTASKPRGAALSRRFAPSMEKDASEAWRSVELSAGELDRIEALLVEIPHERLQQAIRTASIHRAQKNAWLRAQGWIPCPRCGEWVQSPQVCCLFCQRRIKQE